jgi:hypothetical protein
MARLMTGRHWGLPWVPKIGVYAGEWRVLASLALGVGTIAITAGVLWLLTWIEVAGVRFFHARRGWRVTRAVAWSVCAHASIGWVVGAALLVLGWGLIDLDFWLARSLRTMTVRPRVGDWAAVPAGAGFFAGMMLFEYRVYQGMRVCRFANRRRPDPHAAIPR